MKQKQIDQGAGGNILRALRHPNYRLFFGGQIISLVGTWIQQLAMSWLAYRITGSPFLLGVIGFTGQIPTLFLAPVAGVLADRLNRHRMLIITQTLAMLQAFALSFLVLTGTVSFPWLVGLSLFLGLVNSFDMPVRQSFVVQMVEDRKDLGNAIALNSTIINIARMIGPSVAGILVSLVGEGICFLLNGISYVAVIWALLLMKIKPVPVKELKSHLFAELQDGFQYVFSFPPLRSIILLIGLISLTGMSYTVIMPVYVKEILHGGANTQGFMMGTVGLGALLAALFLASRKTVVGLETYIPVAAGIVGFGLVGFSLSRTLWTALPLLFIVGLGMIIQMASSNTIIQTIVEENKRGRVMSIYTMAFMGIGPFGSLLTGGLAHVIGTPNTLLIGGLCCLAGAALFAGQIGKFHRTIRSTYLKLGLVAERPSGTQTMVEVNPEGYGEK
jgi:MFS family permease